MINKRIQRRLTVLLIVCVVIGCAVLLTWRQQENRLSQMPPDNQVLNTEAVPQDMRPPLEGQIVEIKPDASSDHQPFDRTIEIKTDSFVPQTLSVSNQALVRWLNTTPESQTVTFNQESIVLPPAADYVFPFDALPVGEYSFSVNSIPQLGKVMIID